MSETRRPGRRRLLLLPLVALLAVLPLLWKGCSCGHDFDFHLVSWMEAATQFRAGALHPHWAFTPAYNAGEPRFVFYPPLSWTLGGLLGLVLPWGATPIVYTWLALTAAGLGCYRLLREFVSPGTALLVSAAYAVNPYMLFTAYERTAYAELLAAAWLPLLLWGVLRRRVTVAGVAIPVALLWLTNAPAAVIGCYGLAILVIARLAWRRNSSTVSLPPSSPLELAGKTSSGVILGIGLAAFYIVPAAWERRYVQIEMAMTDGLRFTDNFLFHRTPDADHDAVLRTASLLAAGLLVAMTATLVAALLRTPRESAERRVLYALAILAAAVALLVTPLSAIVWRHAPELAFLQFPWRFLAILMPALALGLALALPRRVPAPAGIAAGLIGVSLLIVTGYRSFRQECDPEDTTAARLAVFHSAAGSEATDEYTPTTADNDHLGKSNPPFWLVESPDDPPPAHAAAAPLHLPIDVSAAEPATLVLNRREYPAWRVSVNDHVVTERRQRDDGLIAVPIAAGLSHVEIEYARTPDRTAGEAISAISLLGLAWSRKRRRLR